MVELMKVSEPFAATGKTVNDLLASTIASWPRDETTQPEAAEMFASMVRPLMFGEPWESP
jgi:hypothetical protein